MTLANCAVAFSAFAESILRRFKWDRSVTKATFLFHYMLTIGDKPVIQWRPNALKHIINSKQQDG